jgi:uncharacterized repeat protein (TIGR01451 family)
MRVRARRYVLLLLSTVLVVLALPVRAHAAPGVSITMSSDPTIHLDSNKPCVQGFSSAYIAFRVQNTTASALSRVSVVLSGFANGFHLEGGQAATQYIGSMQPGATETVYWYVTAPCTFNQTVTLTATATDATPGSTTGSGIVSTKQSISANAGGTIVGSTLGAGAIVGQTIYMDARYSFGGVQSGDTYSFQPAGNTTFNAMCFQMTGSEIVSSGANAVPTGTRDTEFFRASASQSGNGHEVVVRWYFRYLCENTTTNAKPYATQQSGSTNLKYSGNYDAYVGPTLPGATNPYIVTMSVSPSILGTGGVVTYTLTVQNPSTLTGTLDYVGVQLPAGVTFNALAAGSNVTTANSAEYPAAGATGLLIWRGSPEQSYIVPGGTSLILRFTATVTSTPGSYTAQGSGVAGLTLLGVASATVTVGADVRTTLTGDTSVLAGISAQYVITTSNYGSAAATAVASQIALPAGFTLVSATRGGTLSGANVTWPAVPLANGASVVDTIVVRAAQAGTFTVIGSSTATTSDPTASNNDGSAANARVTVAVSAVPAMLLSRSVSTGTPLPGTDVTHTFIVENAGGAAAHQVLLSDVLAVEYAFKLNSISTTLSAGLTVTASYSTDGVAWTYAPVSGACGAPAGYDACVRGIRWTVAQPVSAGITAGTFVYVARVR